MAKGILGNLEEFELKKTHARKRLSKVFSAFVVTPGGGYFVCGGQVPPAFFANENFSCVIIGHSQGDLSVGRDMLREINSHISSNFSDQDFHATVARDYFSTYLRSALENMKIPQAAAVEFMIVDFRGCLMRVYFSGDVEIDDMVGSKEQAFTTGCYDAKFKRQLLDELKRAPKTINAEEMKKFADQLVKKLKLAHIGYCL